jgi:hypothetical protein
MIPANKRGTGGKGQQMFHSCGIELAISSTCPIDQQFNTFSNTMKSIDTVDPDVYICIVVVYTYCIRKYKLIL